MGCCITIIWLVLNSHMWDRFLPPTRWLGSYLSVLSQGHCIPLFGRCLDSRAQLRVVALPLSGVAWTLCTGEVFCLLLGPRGSARSVGFIGESRWSGDWLLLFSSYCYHTITVTNAITVTGTVSFLL